MSIDHSSQSPSIMGTQITHGEGAHRRQPNCLAKPSRAGSIPHDLHERREVREATQLDNNGLDMNDYMLPDIFE